MQIVPTNRLTIATMLGFCLFGLNGIHAYYTHLSVNIAEICDNGKDDDNDGLIDLNDDDCNCEVLDPTSLIPNPSFEETNCCPQERNELNCADGWIQASEPTTDLLHTCGWMGWDNFPPPLPFPEGNSALGFRDGRVRPSIDSEPNWKEYAGACLLQPLFAGMTYRFEFYVGFVGQSNSPPINITFFGTQDCENLPFGKGDVAFGCPTNDPKWSQLNSTLVSSGGARKWIQASIEVTPLENINAIAIGPDCSASTNPVSTYYFFDNLVLADVRALDFQVKGVNHPCGDEFLLEVPAQENLVYQWYKEGIALLGETMPSLSKIYGEGAYQVRIVKEKTCMVTKAYIYQKPEIINQVVETICQEDSYPFGELELNTTGMYIDTFKSQDNCDSIVYLDLEVLELSIDTIEAKIFDGEGFKIGNQAINEPGEHFIHLISARGCDSLIYLHLAHYQIFIPNVFTPNGDGHNDILQILGEDELINERNMTIFDRWGNQVHQGSDWDGKLNGAYVDSGVYTFIVTLKTKESSTYQYAETITVLR